MSNPTGGFGLRPVRRRDGAAWTGQLTAVQIAYNNAHTFGKGDPVQSNSSGFIDLWSSGTNSGAIRGVFWGCEYLDPVLGFIDWKNAWLAPSGLASTTIVTAYIIDDPNLIFQIRATSALQVTQANVWENATFTAAGSPTTLPKGLSTATLSGIATTSTLPLRITGLSQLVGNDNTSTSNIAEVVFNNFELSIGTTGI